MKLHNFLSIKVICSVDNFFFSHQNSS
ncbi:hypothetical protein OIU77_015249 [Salix suchowensis]|uniref:Photosystem II protein I n=1 Tax=Salix suchowensis TaxID=1278906 RepID=A0ABQ8ZS29_9ROSI|nr:hypothetical protein OIU77_015249 [Salix suchowensis]